MTIIPETDEEVYFSIVDEYGEVVDPYTTVFFRELLAVRFYVKPFKRRIIVKGQRPADEFFDKVMEVFHFKDPRKYFDYEGGYTISFGELHNGYHISAGTSLGSLKDRCNIDLVDGSIGGLINVENDLFAITAGHCVSRSTSASASSNHFDIVARFEDSVVIRLKKLSTDKYVESQNPLYIDDDKAMHQDYLTNLAQARDEPIDPETCSLQSFEASFPFIDARTLEPSTKVMKLDATTGYTEGKLLGVQSTDFYDKKLDRQVSLKSAILIHQDPHSRFSSEGDSGSIVYAQKGALRYPVAVLCGEFDFKSVSQYGEERVETVSYANLLKPLLENLKESLKENLEDINLA